MSVVADGRLEEAPAFLKDSSEAERLQWLVEQQKAKRDRAAAVPGPLPPPTEAALPTPDPSPEVFAAADLFTAPNAVWHIMPNGKRVAVHPVSVVEAIRLNSAAEAEVEKLPPTMADLEKRYHAHYRPMAWQVVLCCRTGLEPTSARVFKDSDVEVLLRNPGWLETIQAIVKKSNQAGGEEKVLKEVLRGFFGATEHYLQTLLSQWSTASPEELQASLAGFVRCVSHMKSADSLTESDVAAVRGLR